MQTVTNRRDAEFEIPNFCPSCGVKIIYIFNPPKILEFTNQPLNELQFDLWWNEDETMLMAECDKCGTHFGVAGTY